MVDARTRSVATVANAIRASHSMSMVSSAMVGSFFRESLKFEKIKS